MPVMARASAPTTTISLRAMAPTGSPLPDQWICRARTLRWQFPADKGQLGMRWDNDVMTSIAVIGLGAMGSPITRRLLDAGHDLVVWNRTGEKAEPLVDLGAGSADTPSDAAR